MKNDDITLDTFIKKKELLNYVKIGETKLDELIRTGKLIQPLMIDGFKDPLYSLQELNEWMKEQREKRKLPKQVSLATN
ncbi:hypothetical protein GCM10012288_07750 [Malaciobacter pacificus]|uniref:Uncharacterized protein n=1 Tax=Malaciobacter pacificus TaxID=1080223 RepID=A0A5C2HEE0_9BACT|nr:hypothetical protein [Malaciobacter pacificus]QEP35174.1 hypothetical protein APAC_2102 [Malaciobacter pacificus]GGD36202.1 hypothetical protein GCM10012288_07750 [Malaciobacter pacificus]